LGTRPTVNELFNFQPERPGSAHALRGRPVLPNQGEFSTCLLNSCLAGPLAGRVQGANYAGNFRLTTPTRPVRYIPQYERPFRQLWILV